ncbi:MAG: hypothetical protein HY534_08310 [Chloroflexi bacterium]|nr:hypothetical protein [Chloroflexota bacterium]
MERAARHDSTTSVVGADFGEEKAERALSATTNPLALMKGNEMGIRVRKSPARVVVLGIRGEPFRLRLLDPDEGQLLRDRGISRCSGALGG